MAREQGGREVVGHPLRGRIIDILGDGRMASPSEIARGVGARVEDVAYHVRRLRALGAIELVKRVPIGSSVMNRYRMVDEAQTGPRDLAALPDEDRSRVGKLACDLAVDDIAAAREAGARSGAAVHSVGRAGGPVDPKALAELMEIRAEAWVRSADVLNRARERAGQGRGPDFKRIRIVEMVFETPHPIEALE